MASESAMSNAFATRCIHAGQNADPQTGAIMTPIYMSSTYVQESPGVHKGYEYSRTHNPTRTALQNNLASLEEGQFAFAFASGCAAMSTLLMCLSNGDQVVAMDDLYGGSRRLLTQVFARLGIESSFIDLSDLNNLEQAIKPNTKLIWIETPTNPTLKLVDIKAICTAAHAKNIPVVIDNTFATPYLQQPLKLGADLVVHSTTKYLSGHSDLVGGAIITNNSDWAERLAYVSNAVGAIPSPMDCFLALRGTKTLAIRMKTHCENARQIADFLKTHTQVERVIYPGLPEHPHYELCQQQMRAPGAMISFVIKGGLVAAKHFTSSTKLFACAESLGGVESLIGLPALMTHASVPIEIRQNLGIVDGLIRLSVGIEDPIDLLTDLDKSF
ncbi:MAG: PLP-dependent aspartate aminotransferase family protein [Myxococcaceae bacterium]